MGVKWTVEAQLTNWTRVEYQHNAYIPNKREKCLHTMQVCETYLISFFMCVCSFVLSAWYFLPLWSVFRILFVCYWCCFICFVLFSFICGSCPFQSIKRPHRPNTKFICVCLYQCNATYLFQWMKWVIECRFICVCLCQQPRPRFFLLQAWLKL